VTRSFLASTSLKLFALTIVCNQRLTATASSNRRLIAAAPPYNKQHRLPHRFDYSDGKAS